MGLFLLFFAALSQGCANSPPSVQVERITVPPALLQCDPEPQPGAVKSQRDVALYIIDLRAFGRSCESRLNEIRRLQEEASPRN